METTHTLIALSTSYVQSARTEIAHLGPSRDAQGRISTRPYSVDSGAGRDWAGAVDALFQAIGFQRRPAVSYVTGRGGAGL